MKRFYKEAYPSHVYCKGAGGNVIFYSTSDCIYYITLYYCLAREHHIRTDAFSIMPNHTHSQQNAERRSDFISFNRDLSSQFTRGYNKQHCRCGELFQKPFGSAPKVGEKYIRNNLSYINNNGASGKLSKGVIDYRWNLMAYHGTDHPFSEKIVPNRASRRMRWSIKYIDRMRVDNRPLDYRLQEMLFKGLNRKEGKQLLDYIISKYNFLDYDSILRHYGTFENALLAMDANTGSEHDIKEDWEDFSEYRDMMEASRKAGFSMDRINFKLLDKEELLNLVILLSGLTKDKKKIYRFLHLDSDKDVFDL